MLSTSQARLLPGAGDSAVKKLDKVLLMRLMIEWGSQTAKKQINMQHAGGRYEGDAMTHKTNESLGRERAWEGLSETGWSGRPP